MIVITGATGKTGSKTAELLLEKGEKIRVLGRFENKLRRLAEKGAEIMAGDQSDIEFLTRAFTGADALYLLIPPKMDTEDSRKYYNTMGDVAINAIKNSGIKKVVFLSSLGAEQDYGTGPVLGLHDVEQKLRMLDKTDIVFLRAGYFMENTLMNLSLIKNSKIIGNTMSPDAYILTIAAKDIAYKAAQLLASRDFKGHGVVDLFGQRISYRKIAQIIGSKIGNPDLPYVQFKDNEAVTGMMGMGLSRNLSESFTELSHGISTGKIRTTVGKPDKPNAPTKFEQFVDEVFYPAYTNA